MIVSVGVSTILMGRHTICRPMKIQILSFDRMFSNMMGENMTFGLTKRHRTDAFTVMMVNVQCDVNS